MKGRLVVACQPSCPDYPRGLVIERDSADMDKVFASDAVVEILAEGFLWAEGPSWVGTG